MQAIVDFILLAASAAAAIYCFVLSARLKKLNDLRSGLGAGIPSMSVTLKQTRDMLEATKKISLESEAKLKTLLEDASRLAPELADLLEAIIEAGDQAADDIARARAAALVEVKPHAAPRQEKGLKPSAPARSDWAA